MSTETRRILVIGELKLNRELGLRCSVGPYCT
jgi:hypothetical protein